MNTLENVSGSVVAGLPTIFNTDGLKGELLTLVGIAVVAVALMALLAYGSKKSGMRDMLQSAGAVLIVLLIIGMGALVGTDAGRRLVATVFNLG